MFPGRSLVRCDISLHIHPDLHDLLPGYAQGLSPARSESSRQQPGKGLEARMKSPGEQMPAGENGAHSRRSVLPQLQDDAIHLPHVAAAAIDQLLIQDLSPELHLSLPSVEAGWPPAPAPRRAG